MLEANMTLRRILEVLVSAEEFLNIPVRRHEESELRRLIRSAPLALKGADNCDSRAKVHVLFQAHFSRKPLSSDMLYDRNEAVKTAARLLFALVDVVSSSGWLRPALAAMELSQMLTQAIWDDESPLLQLPHINVASEKLLREIGVESPLDLAAKGESVIRKVIKISDEEFADMATVANAFPNPELKFELKNRGECIFSGRKATLNCTLARDEDEDDTENDGALTVFCPWFPVKKGETWWVILGEANTNRLLGIKRISMTRRIMSFELNFVPGEAGKQIYVLYLMSDSYMGVDREYNLEIEVLAESDDVKKQKRCRGSVSKENQTVDSKKNKKVNVDK